MKKVLFISASLLLALNVLGAKIKEKKDPITDIISAEVKIGSQGSQMGTKVPSIDTFATVNQKDGKIERIFLTFVFKDHDEKYEFGEGNNLSGKNNFKVDLSRTKLEENSGMNITTAILVDKNERVVVIKEYYESDITKQDLINMVNMIKEDKKTLLRLNLVNKRTVDLTYKNAKAIEEIIKYIDSLES